MNKNLLNDQALETISRRFKKQFETDPLLVSVPGRINIIGEHTDYNGGWVLPSAINRYVYMFMSVTKSPILSAYSDQFDDELRVDLSSATPIEGWGRYIQGACLLFRERTGIDFGLQLMLTSTIPVGAGLSSSAALIIGVLKGLIQIFSAEMKEDDVIQMAQQVEHRFAGVQSGVMDFYAVYSSKKDHAILLDCVHLNKSYIPVSTPGYSWLLFDTGVHHELASSAYNDRRETCEKALKKLQEFDSNIRQLRDLGETLVEPYASILSPDEQKKIDFVCRENARVHQVVTYLQKGDVLALGKILFDTHFGLKNDYEVSCEELDFLVEAALGDQAILGARMMGGGFGGCTLNLVQSSAIENVSQGMSAQYRSQTGRPLQVYPVELVQGAETRHSFE